LKRLNIDKKILIIFSACHIIYTSTFAEESNKIIDATDIPFEELLQTDYIPASKIAEQINSSSSAVSTVTAREIKLYGYKTLSEILNSMRGLHTFQGYDYTFIGGRGYGIPGEYAGRIIVLIDGYQINDSMYGQAFFDQDALLDVSLIEKVEYVPGGSSSGYTNNALLGIINIITKNGNTINGTKVSYGYGSHKTQNRRVTFGKKFENSADVLFSLSDYKTAGRDFNYILNDQNISNNNNDDENYRMFLKTAYKNFTLEGALSTRTKNIPSYPLSSQISEKTMEQKDDSNFIRLKYDTDITANTKLSTSMWYGDYFYGYTDDILVDEFGNGYFQHNTKAKWYGYDMKIIGTWFDKHTISIGTEYKHDYFFGDYSIWNNYSSDYKYDSKKLYTGYFYDNYELFNSLTLNYGARVEQTNTNNNKEISPQIAILWQVHKNTLLKLSTSKTSRQPTLYENRREKLENARKTEFVIEQSFDNNIKFLTSLYNYHISDRATWYDNGDIKANGFENEIEKYFDNDVELKASYAYQKAYQIEYKDIPLVNTPTHMAKLHMGIPLIGKDLQMGTELLYLGSRPDFYQNTVKSHTITNLNFLSQDWIQNTDLSFKINNLFNKRYNDITANYITEEKYYPQDGRTFYLEMEYKF
jgi:outer membrane receptor for ferrienterochelin and colicins